MGGGGEITRSRDAHVMRFHPKQERMSNKSSFSLEIFLSLNRKQMKENGEKTYGQLLK